MKPAEVLVRSMVVQVVQVIPNITHNAKPGTGLHGVRICIITAAMGVRLDRPDRNAVTRACRTAGTLQRAGLPRTAPHHRGRRSGRAPCAGLWRAGGACGRR